jgi:hypothetical protein
MRVEIYSILVIVASYFIKNYFNLSDKMFYGLIVALLFMVFQAIG